MINALVKIFKIFGTKPQKFAVTIFSNPWRFSERLICGTDV